MTINDDDQKKRIIITITFPEVVFSLTPRDLTGKLAATRAATTAGVGFPSQSQRRWWSPLEWRLHGRPDKDGGSARNSPRRRRLCSRGTGWKGWRPAADGRGRTAARAGCVVFVGHMHASENQALPRPEEVVGKFKK